MADITASGSTGYPAVLDTRTTLADGSGGDEIVSANVNGPAAAVVAVETELGLLPKGSAADVVTRLNVSQNADGTIKSSVVAGTIPTYSAGIFTISNATGTWTPAVGGTATYTQQTGFYSKIGTQVFVYADLIINAIGTGSTTVVQPLPFASRASSYSAGNVGFYTGLASSVTWISCYSTSATTTVSFQANTVATSNEATPAIFGSGTRVQFSLTYEASS